MRGCHHTNRGACAIPTLGMTIPHSRVPPPVRALLSTLILATAFPLAAATIEVRVQNARGKAVRDAVVFAVPEGRQVPLARNKTAVLDQRNRMFIPHVLPVQT